MAKSGDPFRDLLFAELAVVLEVASAKEVADAIESYWGKRDQLDASFGERLTRVAGIGADDLARIEAQIDGLVREAGGDTRQALLTHGGVDPTLLHSLPANSLVSREVGALESELRRAKELRPIDPGRYEHLAAVGEGGMGVVILARDRELQRQVALKIMRTGSGGSSAADRFLREAQITSSLEHPGIVPIHEIGRIDDAVPYYTMRYVAGQRTLLDAIREGATVAGRLPLLEPFLRVCDTTRYAHSKGVLHCDIKPANIGLGSFGETILLDWGLARVMNEGVPPTGGTSGTPGYASPEAAGVRADAVTERSDVYSLGATLFHILTAAPPLVFETLDEMRQRLAVEPAPKAVDRDPGVPEALSRLCERALAPDPADRFADVAAFSDAVRAWRERNEVERELAGLAREADQALADAADLPGDEQARRLDRVLGLVTRMRALDPDAADADRLQEHAERQREQLAHARERASRSRLLKRVGIAALLVATVTTAIMAWVLESRRAETESARRDVATERDRAEDLADFMLVDLHEKLNELGRLELLGSAARKLLSYYDTAAAPQTVEARRKKAILLSRISGIFRKEGSVDEAVPAIRRATALFEELHAERPGDSPVALELARSHVAAIAPFNDLGETDEARKSARRALSLYKRILKANPGVPALRAEYAEALFSFADFARWHANVARALELSGEAVRIQRELAELLTDDPDSRAALAHGIGRRASLLRQRGDTEQALRDFEEALSVLEKSAPKLHIRRQRANFHVQLSEIHVEHERFVDARKHAESALQLRRSIALADPRDVSRQFLVGQSLRAVADVYSRSEDRAKAWAPAREAIELYRGLAAMDPESRVWPRELSNAHHELGDMHRVATDFPGARTHFLKTVELRRTLHDEQPTLLTKRDLAHGLTALGRGHADLRERGKAIACFEEAEALLAEVAAQDPTSRDHHRCWNAYWLADAYRDKGDAAAARRHYETALEVHKRALEAEPDHPRLHCNMSEIHTWIGDISRKSGELEQALPHYTQARDIATKLCARKNPGWRSVQALARANALRGVVLLGLRRYEAATEAFRLGARENERLVALRRSSQATQDWYEGRVRVTALASGDVKPENATDYALLGELAHHEKRHEDAVGFFLTAFADEKVMGADEYLDYGVRSAAQAEGRRDRAIVWLRASVTLLRRRIAWADGQIATEKGEQRRVALVAQRGRWQRHLVFLRDTDPQLASIRGLPAFQAAFEE